MHKLSVIYGTLNQAKIEYMKQLVSNLPVEIKGLSEKVGPIAESGNSPLENARIKALAFFKTLKQPVFSCDSGLYFKNLPKDQQPGTYIRRINNKSLTDDEMISYYSNLAKNYGGRLTAYYQNAICLVWRNDLVFEYAGDDIASEPFYLVEQSHSKRISGFPLDSLSVDINSGKYYYDLENYNYSDSKSAAGFCAFFERVLCKLRSGLYFEH